MSAAVISLNPDLRRLQDEGYELDVCDGYALVHNVPYLDASRTVQYGVLVSPLTMSGDRVCYQKNACKHIMNFCGSMPYRNTGEPLKEILLDHNTCVVSGVSTNMRFSSKPHGDYNDYYEKFTGYIRILSAEAQAVDPNVTAATFKRIVSSEDSVFCYADTNASRADITGFTDGFKKQKVGIVGLGGTGSYILDQVAKTPVAEIHLYDGDVFCQHNAFRAPGAPPKELFLQQPMKVDYFKEIYSHMHCHIFAHGYNLEEENLSELQTLNFVFLAMDSGPSKRVIVDWGRTFHLCRYGYRQNQRRNQPSCLSLRPSLSPLIQPPFCLCSTFLLLSYQPSLGKPVETNILFFDFLPSCGLLGNQKIHLYKE